MTPYFMCADGVTGWGGWSLADRCRRLCMPPRRWVKYGGGAALAALVAVTLKVSVRDGEVSVSYSSDSGCRYTDIQYAGTEPTFRGQCSSPVSGALARGVGLAFGAGYLATEGSRRSCS
jgi:hypothetical protein